MDQKDQLHSSQHFLSGKKFIIAGAGISGLAFAIALRKQWPAANSTSAPPSITIYERDSQANALGREGYSLSLRTDAPTEGLQTIQKLGLLDELIEESITGLNHEGGFTMWDKNWNQILKIQKGPPPGLPVGGMRIIRSKLRGTLIQGAAQSGDEVHWGVACASVQRFPHGKIEVTLSNGKVEECDFLIAADGASSKIRDRLRPDDTLQFAGVCMISALSRFDDSPVPSTISKDWGVVISGEGYSIFSSPQDAHSTIWSMGYTAKEPGPTMKQPIHKKDFENILASVKERGKTLPPLFHELLERTDPSTLMVSNAMDKHPFAHDLTQGNIVFLGDANHAVTPYSGSGVNLAIMDGWDFAEQLLKAASFAEAVNKYDAIVVPRSKTVLSRSHMNIAVGHSSGWKSGIYIFFLKMIAFLFLRGSGKDAK